MSTLTFVTPAFVLGPDILLIVIMAWQLRVSRKVIPDWVLKKIWTIIFKSGLDIQLIFRIVKVPRGLQAAESLQPMMKSDIGMCKFQERKKALKCKLHWYPKLYKLVILFVGLPCAFWF